MPRRARAELTLRARSIFSTRRLMDPSRQQAARPAGEAEDAASSLRPHEFLKDARSRADANDPVEISVRDLLTLWTAKSRGHRISQRIEADLANHGLITSPSFRAVTPDAAVRLVAAPLESGTSGAAPADADDAAELTAMPPPSTCEKTASAASVGATRAPLVRMLRRRRGTKAPAIHPLQRMPFGSPFGSP